MKKFIGNVNGKSFDNEEDFNKAAQEAIGANDGSLSISSYYSYTNDDKDSEKQIDDVKDDKFVSAHEYFLGDVKPDKVTKDEVVYNVPETLKQRLAEASNKKSVQQNLNYHISRLDEVISVHADDLKILENKIEDLQDRLFNKLEDLNELKGRRNYYTNLLDTVDSALKEEEAKKETKKEEVRNVLGIKDDASLLTFLKELGFLK